MPKPNLDTVPQEFTNLAGGAELMPIAPEGDLGVLTEPTFAEAYSGADPEDLPERFLTVVRTLGPWLLENAAEVQFPHHTAVRTAWHHLPEEADITESVQFKAVQYAYFASQSQPAMLPMLLETASILDTPEPSKS